MKRPDDTQRVDFLDEAVEGQRVISFGGSIWVPVCPGGKFNPNYTVRNLIDSGIDAESRKRGK